MPTYITLLNYTQKGIEKIKESPSRLDKAKKLYKSMGAELKEFYLVTRRYDIVVIAEVPDDDTMAKITLSIGSLGAVRTETLRAFPEKDYRKLISSLP